MLKKLREKEELLEEIELDFNNQNCPRPKSPKKLCTKFSVNTAKDLLETRKSRTKTVKIKKFRDAKANSENKYTGTLLYQIFIAKFPELQMLSSKFISNIEKKSSKSTSVWDNLSPQLKKTSNMKDFKVEVDMIKQDFEDEKEEEEKIVHSTPRKNKRKYIEKPCNFFMILTF